MKKVFLTIFALCLGISGLWAQGNFNLNRLGNLTYTRDLSDIWGYRHPSGTEYALVGVYNGTSIVSLADPANPVQVQFIPGANSTWRDLKTFGNYAYVTADQGQDGLLIINLNNLPGSITTTFYKPRITVNGTTDTLKKAHNLYIDENGYCIIAGSNLKNGEPIIFNLNGTPTAPVFVGATPSIYAHDVFARGDTLWTSDIYAGKFSGYNMSNKSNLVLLGSHSTPFNFTHNAWISNNGRTLFTTDEVANAYIGAYDVSDMSNIKEIDRWRPLESEGTGVVPHNVHVHNDYLVISHYSDGVIIVDASRPSNMIEVGKYDTYPQAGTGFNGCWGAYPFLPSGKLLATDISTGLHVFQPTYVRACWLEGVIRDSLSNNPIFDAKVEILATAAYDNSVLTGDYKTGYGVAGTYNVRYSKAGYYSKTISVTLQNGVLTIRDVKLLPMTAFGLTGQVVDADNGNAPVANAKVQLVSPDYTYNATTNASGNFSIPSMFQDNYEIYAGKWGYKTILQNQNLSSATGSIVLPLNKGYRDEFALDLGWTATYTASSGWWERAHSEQIMLSGGNAGTPDGDLPGDIGDKCYVSGANNNGSIGADDIDNGNIVLRSPNFDLSGYTTPYVSYYAWFVNTLGSGTPNDSMIVRIYNGTTSKVLAIYNVSTFAWTPIQNFKVSNYLTPTATMWIEVEAFDKNPGHIVEVAFDLFEVVDSAATPVAVIPTETEFASTITVYPNPSNNEFVLDLTADLFNNRSSIILQVFNQLGQVVENRRIKSGSLGLLQIGSEWPAGVYYLRIGEKQAKLVKN